MTVANHAPEDLGDHRPPLQERQALRSPIPRQSRTANLEKLAGSRLTRRRFAVDLTDGSAGDLAAGADKVDLVDLAISAFHIDGRRRLAAVEFLFLSYLNWSEREIFPV